MVCPMRFVLVGFSVVVATFGIFMYREQSQFVLKNDRNDKKQDLKKRSASVLQLMWNVINGQFLYKETERARKHGGLTYFVYNFMIFIKTKFQKSCQFL